MRKWYFIMSIALIVGLLTWINLGFIIRKFVFQPEKLEESYTFNFQQAFEEIYIESTDGSKLDGIWFPSTEAKATILYFHGNRDNLKRWGEIAKAYTKYQVNVLVMDYRTYGKSSGIITENLLNEDASLWYNKAKELGNGLPIIVYGRSLGTGIAAKLASEKVVRGLILETPYTSMVDVLDHYAPKWIANKSDIVFAIPQNLKNKQIPILIFHGTKDEIIPFEIGDEVSKSLAGKNTSFIKIEGGSHNDLSNYPIYWDQMDAWMLSL